MKKALVASIAFVGFAGATLAFADDDGVYILGGLGQMSGKGLQSQNDSLLGSNGGRGFGSSQNQASIYKLQLGYNINKNVSVEGGYISSNNSNYTASGGNLAGGAATISGKVSGWNLGAVGILPVADQISLLGKLGFAGLRTSGTLFGGASGNAISNGSSTKNALTYGIGAKYDFTKSIFGRLDVDSYQTSNGTASGRSTVWMFDVGYKF